MWKIFYFHFTYRNPKPFFLFFSELFPFRLGSGAVFVGCFGCFVVKTDTGLLHNFYWTFFVEFRRKTNVFIALLMNTYSKWWAHTVKASIGAATISKIWNNSRALVKLWPYVSLTQMQYKFYKLKHSNGSKWVITILNVRVCAFIYNNIRMNRMTLAPCRAHYYLFSAIFRICDVMNLLLIFLQSNSRDSWQQFH